MTTTELWTIVHANGSVPSVSWPMTKNDVNGFDPCEEVNSIVARFEALDGFLVFLSEHEARNACGTLHLDGGSYTVRRLREVVAHLVLSA